jgi:lysophospholipid acyltransferase (LPLAT)-like uncharacterized protein
VFLGRLGAYVLRGLQATIHWQKEGLDVEGVPWAFADPLIVAFWHGDQLMAPWAYLSPQPPTRGMPRRRARVLISEHSDGRIIAAAMRSLGISNIPGSSTRGGARAFAQMKEAIQQDQDHIAITPDGPKGPVRTVKKGVIRLSSQTGAPILPIGLAYNRAWRAKSWDRMLVPLPFAKGAMVGGELFRVPQGLQEEELGGYAKILGEHLDRVKERAEELVSRSAQSSQSLREGGKTLQS